MSIFNIDYINYVWKLLVPPAKRQPKWLAWGASVMAARQWWSDSIVNTWAQGTDYTDLPYNPLGSHTYHSGDRMIFPIQSETSAYTGSYSYYGDNGVYEALCINADGSINGSGFSSLPPLGNNIAPQTSPATIVTSSQALAWLYGYSVNYPAWIAQNYVAGQIVLYTDGNAYICILNTTSSQNPSNTTYWQLRGRPGCLWVRVSPNYIGTYERASYSCQKIIYEYALNRWFKTTFRQPAAGLSDIYITINSVTNNRFYFYPERFESYFLPITLTPPATGPLSSYFFPSSAITAQYDFTIHIPVAVYNALSANSSLRSGVVEAFANLLCPAGGFYNIVTY